MGDLLPKEWDAIVTATMEHDSMARQELDGIMVIQVPSVKTWNHIVVDLAASGHGKLAHLLVDDSQFTHDGEIWRIEFPNLRGN